MRDPEQGWRPCAPGSVGAREDLNRLTFLLQSGYDGLYEAVGPPYGSPRAASEDAFEAIEAEWTAFTET